MLNSARLTRGFRRLGLVLALPCLAVSLIIAAAGLYNYCTTTDPDAWWKNAPLAKQEPSSRTVTFDDLAPKKLDEKGPWTQYQQKNAKLVPVDFNPFAAAELRSSLLLAGIVAAVGAALFALCWAVGWTLAGFARD